MGGYGSGQWHSNTRPVKENGLTLDWKVFSKTEGYSSGVISWKRDGEPFANIGYYRTGDVITLDYKKAGVPVKYPVSLITTSQPKGGIRYWFTCPRCGRRSGKLYSLPGDSRFLCRKCHNLTYQSSNESHGFDKYLIPMALEAGVSLREIKREFKRGLLP